MPKARRVNEKPRSGDRYWALLSTVADAVAFDAETIAASLSDWWPKARWALEASLDDDPAKREVGLAALKLLNACSLSGKEETLRSMEGTAPRQNGGESFGRQEFL